MHTDARMVNISTLDIAQAAEYHNFAYSVPRRDVAGLEAFLGPRTILARLALATATTGQILRLPASFTNATYEQNFCAPFVQCQDASVATRTQIDAAAERTSEASSPSVKVVSIEYFALIPALSNINSTTFASVQSANVSDVDGTRYASNHLWLRFSRRLQNDTNVTVTDMIEPHYLSCELHNATYRVNFTWFNGIQAINVLDLAVGDIVHYPGNASSPINYTTMAYSAFMLAMSNQLTGSMGFYQDTSAGLNMSEGSTSIYSKIATDIDKTSLLGSSDFDKYFMKNHALSGSSPPGELFSPQRIQDMEFSRHRTLNDLIQELSINMTLSLISNPLMA